MFRAFWSCEAGFVVTAEWVLVMAIVFLGLLVGISGLRAAFLQECADFQQALRGKWRAYQVPSQSWSDCRLTDAEGKPARAWASGSRFPPRAQTRLRDDGDIMCDAVELLPRR